MTLCGHPYVNPCPCLFFLCWAIGESYYTTKESSEEQGLHTYKSCSWDLIPICSSEWACAFCALSIHANLTSPKRFSVLMMLLINLSIFHGVCRLVCNILTRFRQYEMTKKNKKLPPLIWSSKRDSEIDGFCFSVEWWSSFVIFKPCHGGFAKRFWKAYKTSLIYSVSLLCGSVYCTCARSSKRCPNRTKCFLKTDIALIRLPIPSFISWGFCIIYVYFYRIILDINFSCNLE